MYGPLDFKESFMVLLLFIAPCNSYLERFGFPLLGIFLGAIGEIPNDDGVEDYQYRSVRIDSLQSITLNGVHYQVS